LAICGHLCYYKNFITVYQVQHAGFPKNGNTAIEAFNKFAQKRWGNRSK